MIDLANRVIFIHIPKNAGQAIEDYFRRIRSLSHLEDSALFMGLIGRSSALPRHTSHCTLAEYERFYFGGPIPEDFRIFAVVRNPHSRFISEFLYRKFPPWKRFPVRFRLPQKYFVRLARARHPYLKDFNSHILPQVAYLHGLSSARVRLLRFEDLSRDFREMQNDWTLPQIELRKVNSRKTVKADLALSAEMEEFIATSYRDDFEQLGYVL